MVLTENKYDDRDFESTPESDGDEMSLLGEQLWKDIHGNGIQAGEPGYQFISGFKSSAYPLLFTFRHERELNLPAVGRSYPNLTIYGSIGKVSLLEAKIIKSPAAGADIKKLSK